MLKVQLEIILDLCNKNNINLSKEQLIALCNLAEHKINDAINLYYASPDANKKYVLKTILNKDFILSSMYLKLVYYVANYDASKMNELLDIINCYQITKMPSFPILIELFFEVANSNTFMKKKRDESLLLIVDDSLKFTTIKKEKIVKRIRQNYNDFIKDYDKIHFEDTDLDDKLIEHLENEFIIHSPNAEVSAEKLMLTRNPKIIKFDKTS